MAATEPRGERDGHGRGEVGAAEVVDVVVLGDDEALPLAVRVGSTVPVELQEDGRRSSESSVTYVFGTSIGRGSSPGARCQNLPRPGPVGNVGDDVELLSGRLERPLEREVVASSRRPAGAAHRARAGTAAVRPGSDARAAAPPPPRSERAARRRAGPEPFIVATYCETRARSSGRSRGSRRRARARGEIGRRRRARARARPGRRASAFTTSASTSAVGAMAVRDATRSPRRAGSRAWRSAERRPGSMPSSSTSARASGVGLERLGLTSRAVERRASAGYADPLAQRVLGDERLELGDDLRRHARARSRRRSAPPARRAGAPRAA